MCGSLQDRLSGCIRLYIRPAESCGSIINQQMVDRDLIYILYVNTGNVLEVQIVGKRSEDVLMSEINLIYLQHLES